MVLGDLAKVFNAQNTRLKLGPDEIITIYNINKSKIHPRARVNTRTGAADFFSNPLIAVTFEALVTEAIFDTLAALNTLNARGVLPSQAYTAIGENINGVVGDDLSVAFTAYLSDMTDIGPENGAYVVRCTLIIQNSTYIIA